MIRVDYSGMNWKKIGIQSNMVHTNCGGQVWYSYAFDSYFCSTCGRWVDVRCRNDIQDNSDRPSNAVILLNIISKKN